MYLYDAICGMSNHIFIIFQLAFLFTKSSEAVPEEPLGITAFSYQAVPTRHEIPMGLAGEI